LGDLEEGVNHAIAFSAGFSFRHFLTTKNFKMFFEKNCKLFQNLYQFSGFLSTFSQFPSQFSVAKQSWGKS